jgi:hypothetical protein
MRLPKDPYVNGQPIEAYLYKDASECPICFMYYPPYLNKTRCCDQPICSECFVQIKRPDPHPPEHEQPGQQRPPEEEAEMLVSEVAACPFCVTPEFGITYDPPSFRRGLAYAHSNSLRNPTSAMSSSSSLGGTPTGRRRATSLSANAPQVITTDRVRPDWAKKLADARAHALRRSAAATALHNAAYVLGNQAEGLPRGTLPTFGRRRRTLFGDSPSASGSGTPRGGESILISPYGQLLRQGVNPAGGDEVEDGLPTRGSTSRRSRMDDLEDLMMMEAIRLSLVAEEDRKRKEEKEAKKEAKKRAKEEKKEAKHAEKMARKSGIASSSLHNVGSTDSVNTWATTSMARSTSNLGALPEEQPQGKGKAPVQDFAGFNPLSEPSSTLNTEMKEPHDEPSPPTGDGLSTTADSQRYLEESRANIHPTPAVPIPTSAPRMTTHMRQLSNDSSVASSFADSAPGSLQAPSNLPSATGSGLDLPSSGAETPAPGTSTPSHEPMLNFRSLAAVIGNEDKQSAENDHIEHADPAEEDLKEPSPTASPVVEGNRSRGDSGESSGSAPPPIYVEDASVDGDQITPAPIVSHDVDSKDIEKVNIWDHGHVREATQ